VETTPDGQIGPEWRVLLDSVERAFVGWQDSNLRMAESKSTVRGATDPATSRQEPYNCLSVIDLETARSDSGRRDFAFW
jgi:hypothetical protein